MTARTGSVILLYALAAVGAAFVLLFLIAPQLPLVAWMHSPRGSAFGTWSTGIASMLLAMAAFVVRKMDQRAALEQRRREREEEDTRRWQEREAEEARRRALEAAAAEKRSRFLAEFGEVPFAPDPDGERRFVWRYPPGWDAPEGPPERPLNAEEYFWLNLGVWSLAEDVKPTSLEPPTASARDRLIYETDRERSFKRRVTVENTPGLRYAAAVSARRGEREPDKCVRCRRYISGGGTFCSTCHRPVQELRQTNEEDLRAYRERRARGGAG